MIVAINRIVNIVAGKNRLLANTVDIITAMIKRYVTNVEDIISDHVKILCGVESEDK